MSKHLNNKRYEMRALSMRGALVAIFAVSACAPIEDPNAPVDPGGGPVPIAFTFQLPPDQSTVDSVITVGVAGDGLVSATFVVDATNAGGKDTSPFEFEFDPGDWVLGDHTFTVIGQHSSGEARSQSVTVNVQRAVPLQDIQDAIDNLTPGHWYEIPNTRLRAVAYDDPDDPRGDIVDIMRAVSGGAYDTKRDRLVIFGGGGEYSGNEIYAFDLATAAWIRVTDPTPLPPGDEDNSSLSGSYPDGSPISRHTYDLVEYLPPPTDRLFVGGGTSVYAAPYVPGRSGLLDPASYTFDFDALLWTKVSDDTPGSSTYGVAAVAPDGTLWEHGANSNQGLASFDVSTLQWTEYGTPAGLNEGGCAAIDPVRGLFVVLAHGVDTWDLANPDAPRVTLATTGAKEIEGPRSGLAYHPGSGDMVAWGGGSSVYRLDLDTAVWTRVVSTGLVSPGPATPRGTFSRWQYVPSRDVFIIVNEVDLNVFVYRLPDVP